MYEVPRGVGKESARNSSQTTLLSDAVLVVVSCSFELTNQPSGGLIVWALRKARYERACGRYRAFLVVQDFGKEFVRWTASGSSSRDVRV
jgi:hypothetical protein